MLPVLSVNQCSYSHNVLARWGAVTLQKTWIILSYAVRHPSRYICIPENCGRSYSMSSQQRIWYKYLIQVWAGVADKVEERGLRSNSVKVHRNAWAERWVIQQWTHLLHQRSCTSQQDKEVLWCDLSRIRHTSTYSDHCAFCVQLSKSQTSESYIRDILVLWVCGVAGLRTRSVGCHCYSHLFPRRTPFEV